MASMPSQSLSNLSHKSNVPAPSSAPSAVRFSVGSECELFRFHLERLILAKRSSSTSHFGTQAKMEEDYKRNFRALSFPRYLAHAL